MVARAGVAVHEAVSGAIDFASFGVFDAFVAESGIKDRDDIKILEDNKVDAVLVGEALMRSPDRKAYLNKLKYD